MIGSSDRRVRLRFIEDPIELRRTLSAIHDRPGFAWLEEIAFNYPLSLTVGSRELLASARTATVIAVDPSGHPTSIDERPTIEAVRVALAYIARTGTGILDRAVTDGQSTWVLPGATGIRFVLLAGEPAIVRVEVIPSGEHDVAALDAIRDEMRLLVRHSFEYSPAIYQRPSGASGGRRRSELPVAYVTGQGGVLRRRRDVRALRPWEAHPACSVRET